MPNPNISRPMPPWAAQPHDTWTRRIAKRLHGLARQGRCRRHPSGLSAPNPEDQVRVVCISDTHCATPHMPAGDVFLHAGDLTNYGSFGELQDQLDWIRALPHRHKVVVAGNHDMLLDDAFVESHPVREMGRFDKEPGRRKEDLDWGDIIYLEDEAVTLTVDLGGERSFVHLDKKMTTESAATLDGSTAKRTRQVKIYGSPRTPGSGQRAFGFQYDREQADSWTGKIPPDTDIVLVHGPPKFQLDGYLGCERLLEEVWRSRPAVVVCGHIHSGHGRKLLVFDSVQHWYEKILGGQANPGALAMLASHTALTQLNRLLPSRSNAKDTPVQRNSTRVINAALRSGRTVFEATEFEV